MLFLATMISLLGLRKNPNVSTSIHLFLVEVFGYEIWNLAVADKYNAMSELVARISGEYGLENTRQQGRNAINTANVQAQAASALSAQGHLQNLDYAQKFPNNPYQLLESLAGMITGDSGLGGSIVTGKQIGRAHV